MTFTTEENKKVLAVLKQIDECTHTIPLYEDFMLIDPFGHWRFKIEADSVWKDGKAIGKFARIILENNHFSPSCLERVVEKDETCYFPDEIENLIGHWSYIKMEILEESKKQLKRKSRLNEQLDNFKI